MQIDELTEANKILSLQLKHSLARELEWRYVNVQMYLLLTASFKLQHIYCSELHF